MAARQKKPARAPLHSIDAIGRSFHPSGFCSTVTEEERGVTESPGYVLEWNGYTCRRRSLDDGKALRTEIVRTSGVAERLIVVKRLEEQKQEIFQTLNELAGIGKHLLESHLGARGYRGLGRGGGSGRERGRWWSWEYPEMGLGRVVAYNNRMAGMTGARNTAAAGGPQDVLFCRVSLWVTTNLSILLLDAPPAISDGRRQMTTHIPPRLKHQDAATTISTLRSPSSYGTVEDEGVANDSGPGTLERELWNSMGHDSFLEETLGLLAYSHWLRFLETVGPNTGRRETWLLWDALKSLERNLDDSKSTGFRNETTPPGSPVSSTPSSDSTLPSPDDWKDLISRAQHRLYLLQQPQGAQQQLRSSLGEQPRKDINERALDRIAYIGGLLLPMTVISSVLAIEGTYGPEGDKFWVFWLVSVIASVGAVVIIYIEKLRRLQVWFEIAADAVMETGGAFAEEGFWWGEEEKDEDEDVRVVRDGDGVTAWKRGELGWGGAVKKASGYYRWRGDKRLRFDIPKRST